MNAATFEFTSTEERTVAKPKAVVRKVDCQPLLGTPERGDDARWAARADQLFAAFDKDDLPSTSGKFGTLLV